MKPQTILFIGVLLILLVSTTSILAEHEALQESHEARRGAPPKTAPSKQTSSTKKTEPPKKQSTSNPPPKKPAAKPVAKPPVSKPVTKPPVSKPPVTKPPVSKPVTKPPVSKPVTKPPVSKPVSKPPVSKPPVTKPPVSKPVTKPATKPSLPPVKLCNLNKLIMVPGSNVHKFTVKDTNQTKYIQADFDVTWKDGAPKQHSFFEWVRRKMQFDSAIRTMKCQKANIADFGRVCNINPLELQQTYDVAFGDHDIHKCTIPNGYFVISIRFVLSLSDFKTTPRGKWSVFTGLFKARSDAQVKSIISSKVGDIVRYIRSTKLNTFDINYNLNILPQFIKSTLTRVFNSNINSDYVEDIDETRPHDLTDIGYIKVLSPGTEFIIGNIDEGNQGIKQICEVAPFDDKNDCKIAVK